MKIVKVFSWVLRILLLTILVVLVIDNLQTATFNIFGVYFITLPLIVILLIFFFIGIAVGIIASLFKQYELKAKISILEKLAKKNTPQSQYLE